MSDFDVKPAAPTSPTQDRHPDALPHTAEAPTEGARPVPGELNLFFHPEDQLRMSLPDRSYLQVKPAWAAPLSRPGQYLSLMDGKGKEIVLVERPDSLPPASWEAVQMELKRRYLTSTVLRIVTARVEFGATYWTVLTERGERDFVTQSLQENAQWLGDHHLLLIDVDGNRFEIPDVTRLDEPSQQLVQAIL